MGKILTKNPAMTYLVLVNMGLNKLETYEIIGFFPLFVFKIWSHLAGAAWATTQNIWKTTHTKRFQGWIGDPWELATYNIIINSHVEIL